jgi:hypothetical protein
VSSGCGLRTRPPNVGAAAKILTNQKRTADKGVGLQHGGLDLRLMLFTPNRTSIDLTFVRDMDVKCKSYVSYSHIIHHGSIKFQQLLKIMEKKIYMNK